MGGTKFKAKLSGGGMISQDVCYHHRSMTGFINVFKSFANDRNEKTEKMRGYSSRGSFE